jgi:hypothetical protein
MLPLVPRIPMFGGKLAAKKKTEFGNAVNSQHQSSKRHDFRSRQLMHGGPVQRAIHADLLSLRQEFRKDLDNGWSQSSRKSYKVVNRAPGRAFRIFKETFRRTKFGIIHTRCCPPRCDKEAYIQMIFYATLELMSREFQENLHNQSLVNETVNKCFVDAIFAVFALFVLHETNPLPNFPLNDDIIYNKSCDDLSASELKHILSMMPMGASSDQGGRRAFRKYFRAPIRISLDQYYSLIQLRDVSLAVMDLLSCQQPSFVADMALDGIYIIDRLKPSLLLCEYAGPSSVEGLIGSEEYYHSVVLNEKDKYARITANISSASSNPLINKEVHEDLDEVLSMSCFEESMILQQRQYDKLLGCISVDINRFKLNSRPSLKLKSIENILQDMIQGRQGKSRSDFSTISQKIQSALLGHPVHASDSHVNDNNESQESGLGDASALMKFRDNNVIGQLENEFYFPPSLPFGVKAGIRNAFKKMQSVVDSSQDHRLIKSQSYTRMLHTNESIAVNHDEWLFDDYLHTEIEKEHSDEESEPSAMEMSGLQGMSALDNLLSLVEDSRQKRVFLRADSDEDSSSSKSEASLESFGTGPGDKALEVLLTLPKVTTSREGNNRGRNKNRMRSAGPDTDKRNRKQVKSKKVSSLNIKNARTKTKQNRMRKKQKQNDEKSVLSSGSLSTKGILSTSEPGQNALQCLLLQVETHTNTDEISSSGSSKASSTSLEEEETSIEHGKNALNNLLSKIV